MRHSILLSEKGFGLAEVVVSAGLLSVIALGMASLTEMTSKGQKTQRIIASRDDLKTSVDRFTKNFSALKNSALNPAIADPGNLKFRSCLTGIPTAVPCDFAETPFVLLGPLVGTGAFPQSTTPYSGDFDQNGAPCAAPGPNCPIVIRTTFTCPAPCTPGSQVFQIGYTIDGAPGVKVIRHIDTIGRTFETMGPSISSANPSSGTANTLVKWDNTGNNIGSSQVIEDSQGRVGIGISNPTHPLTLQADALGRSLEIRGRAANNQSWLTIASNDGTVNYGGLYGNHPTSGPSSLLLDGASGNLTFTVNSNNLGSTAAISFKTVEAGQGSYVDRLIIDPHGRIGIGTTNPTQPLTVVGNGDPISGHGILLRAGPATSDRLHLFISGAAEENYIASLNTNMHFMFGPGGSEEKVTFMNSGNVGIGTPTPSENLHIFGNGNNFLKIESTIDTQGAGILLKGGTSSTTWEIATQQNYASNALVFSTTPLNSANNKMSILPNGNVGIGTEGPQTKLDVAGGIRPGSGTIGAACNPEGAFAYDIGAHAPVYCNSSGQWAQMGGTQYQVASCVSAPGPCTPPCPAGWTLVNSVQVEYDFTTPDPLERYVGLCRL